MDIYLQLPCGSEPPKLELHEPFKAIVIVEQQVTNEWRNQISDWLVDSGCKYMMAWGQDCSKWDDAVDWSDIARTDYNPSTNDLIMTTWHEEESLQEVFYFAQHFATHPEENLPKLIVVHISETSRAQEFNALHKSGRED